MNFTELKNIKIEKDEFKAKLEEFKKDMAQKNTVQQSTGTLQNLLSVFKNSRAKSTSIAATRKCAKVSQTEISARRNRKNKFAKDSRRRGSKETGGRKCGTGGTG